MPLPLFIGIGAGVAALVGTGAGIHGGIKMKDANDTMKKAQRIHEKCEADFTQKNTATSEKMDELGKLEMEILNGFQDFSDTIEKIQNRPAFAEYHKDGVELPKYDGEEIKNVSVGAGVLLGGLGGAAMGTAGGFAAAGATTAAVMALGTASTGTAIASLSGVALGTAVLGGATLGVGLLVGGIIFSFTGGKLSDKADEALKQATEEEEKVTKICNFLDKLWDAAAQYTQSISDVKDKYDEVYGYVSYVVNKANKIDWNEFTDSEKKATENAVLLVGLLYRMCKVKLVEQSENEDELNTINTVEVSKSIEDSEKVLSAIA